MKANKKFIEEKEAVSAVIGVILMVAITVAIAATVYVYVSGMLGPQTDATESAAVTVEGKAGFIKLTLTKVGDNYPTGGYATTEYLVFVNGEEMINLAVWKAGAPIYVEGKVGTPAEGLIVGTTGTTVMTVGNYDISVSILGTAVGTGTAKVTAP